MSSNAAGSPSAGAGTGGTTGCDASSCTFSGACAPVGGITGISMDGVAVFDSCDCVGSDAAALGVSLATRGDSGTVGDMS